MINVKKQIRKFSVKVFAGLIFGIAAIIGIAATIAFTEPTSGPVGFSEPVNIEDKGDWLGYGRGWNPNSSGIDGITVLTKAGCETATNWYWFEDGNGDGDTTDEEDGICVLDVETTSASWNGDDWATERDNTYIAAYTCSGNFPNGVVATYSGIDDLGNADTTWNNGDCALCQADCYDGKKDLPNQGSWTIPVEDIAGHHGPITPEVLKNWKGTRLPTSSDFYGFCGYKNGDAQCYETGCSSDTTLGNYGQITGRTDKCLDLSNSSWEWLSEQHYFYSARIAGDYACSYSRHISVYFSYRFRAVFRP